MFIVMKPHCKCGYVFDKFTMKNVLYDDSVLFFTDPTVVIEPAHCPKCGEKIEGVIHQHPVDGEFEYDENKYRDYT